MKVADVMKTTVITVRESMTFKEVAQLFYKNRVSCAPVISEKNEVIGFVSEIDLLRAMYPGYSDLLMAGPMAMDFERMESNALEMANKQVKELMAKKVLFVTPDTKAMKAGSIMVRNKVRRLPVVENEQTKKLVGIISQGDICRAVFKKELEFGEK